MDRYENAVKLFDSIWTIKCNIKDMNMRLNEMEAELKQNIIEMGMIDLLSINYSRLGQIAKRRLG